MSIPEFTGILIGTLAFILALALGSMEVCRYHRPLYLRVREVRLIGSSGNHFLVLLRLVFVNEATRGRIPYYLQGPQQGGVTLSQPPYDYEKDDGGVPMMVYRLSNDDTVNVCLPCDEILRLPLDILPQQYRAAWWPIELHLTEVATGIQTIHLEISAEDVCGDIMAAFDGPVELRTHTRR